MAGAIAYPIGATACTAIYGERGGKEEEEVRRDRGVVSAMACVSSVTEIR